MGNKQQWGGKEAKHEGRESGGNGGGGEKASARCKTGWGEGIKEGRKKRSEENLRAKKGGVTQVPGMSKQKKKAERKTKRMGWEEEK